ncbi:class I SAM-dependent methyltransferase [Haloferax sp. DFSO60]|uniref:class I SAM-dependent methyltransferase n=1 Tax=Haloferax sp. DFSO60 TaxID=3388652 RepID=UPI0039781947
MADLDPQDYYDEFAEREWERLERDPVTRLEFENTVAYLDEFLPPSGRVLDAGAGAGRYTVWLAERGFEVEHLDVSAEQVRIARRKVTERGQTDRVTCQQGDVRHFPFADDSFDAVCCLGGPLSHVMGESGRAAALSELRRVAAPDAPVFISVISRFAMLRDILKFSLETSHGLLEPIAADGDYTAERVAEHADGEGWAECHGFRVDEFETVLREAGFEIERLVGLENVANRMKDELKGADSAALEDVRAVVRMLREDRTAVDFSEHMLAVCRA